MFLLWKTSFRVVTACALIFLAFTLPAAAMNLPIEGKVQNSTETFTGTATVHLTGDGVLVLATSKGVACKGNFAFVSRREGNGTVACEDGRLGSFQFVSAGFGGSGSGNIDKEHFDFRIGD